LPNSVGAASLWIYLSTD